MQTTYKKRESKTKLDEQRQIIKEKAERIREEKRKRNNKHKKKSILVIK
jgi:hypothetical protein